MYLCKMKFAACSLVFSILSVLLFNSCKNDLDLNAPYKEIPSIYAVINPQEKVQVIRINKVFLGERDANEMAQVADSINYPAGELTVTLGRYVNGNQTDIIPGKRTITFRDSMIQAGPGSFNTNQRVYVCYENLHQGQPGTPGYTVSGNYLLTVKNTRTGNTFTAQAAGIDSVGSPGSPLINLLGPPYYPTPVGADPKEPNYANYSNQTTSYNIWYKPTSTGKIYQVKLRLWYRDDDLREDFVDYDFTNQYPKDASTSGALQGMIAANFRGQDLFGSLGNVLSRKNVNMANARTMFKIQYFIYSSSQEYLDYIRYVSPSLSISQHKPLYSNISNGALGLFTFRSRCVVSKSMHTFFINEFSTNKSTCAYRFRDSNGKEWGCN
jgi:hypothetical protein